jgi:16S rRNA (guanine527-N7)-methyltransferase
MSSDILDSEGRYWRIPRWFPELGEQVHAQLRAYHAELVYFNGRMNLISPRTEKIADFVHIADGILGSRIVLASTNKTEIFDLGSGNGVPGLIMALLAPDRIIRLVDADARKIEFLKHCVSRFGLKNCFTIHARLEDLSPSTINAAVSRGFASVSKSLLMARRAAAIGCEFFHFKSQAWSTEVAEMPSQILASWDPRHVTDYKLPESDTAMSIVITTRVGK